MPLSSDIADEVMDDLEGGEFALGANWELEGEDDDDICIEEGLRNIGGNQVLAGVLNPSPKMAAV